jgi:hypothetical protein
MTPLPLGDAMVGDAGGSTADVGGWARPRTSS